MWLNANRLMRTGLHMVEVAEVRPRVQGSAFVPTSGRGPALYSHNYYRTFPYVDLMPQDSPARCPVPSSRLDSASRILSPRAVDGILGRLGRTFAVSCRYILHGDVLGSM